MSLASEIDVRGAKAVSDDELVLGEDWVSPTSEAGQALQARRDRRGIISINRSPLARKIITFNLLALIVLVAGVLWLNPTRDNLVVQREAGLVTEAHLIADVFEAQLPAAAPVNLITGDGVDVVETLSGINLSYGVGVYVYDQTGQLVAKTVGQTVPAMPGLIKGERNTVITDFLNSVWETISSVAVSKDPSPMALDIEEDLQTLLPGALGGDTQVQNSVHPEDGTIFSVATPILQGSTAVGVVAISSPSGEIDELVRSEREHRCTQVL